MAQYNPQNFPVGIRFVPSDEELVGVYLKNKNHDLPQPIHVIDEYNIYTCRPDRLPRKFWYGKGNELYFFVARDLTKSKMKRIVENGYGFWRSTGNIAQVKGQNVVIGEKRTFNFFIGHQPERRRTNWIMKEYSLASESSLSSVRGAERKKVDGFVLCKIYEKTSEEIQVEEDQMTEMALENGPHNTDSDVSMEDIEASTSLAFEENQMTEMPLGDDPINCDFPPLRGAVSTDHLLLALDENQMTGMPLGPGFPTRVGDMSTDDFEASKFLACIQKTEMPLGDGPNTPDFPLLRRNVILEDLFLASEENQMTGMPLRNDLNNSEPFRWIVGNEASRSYEENQMTGMPLGNGPNNSKPFRWNVGTKASNSIAFEENQMTRMPLGDGPNNLDCPIFCWDGSMADVEASTSLETRLNREDPINSDLLPLRSDVSIDDPFLALDENQMIGMPLGDGPNNPSLPPLWWDMGMDDFEASELLACIPMTEMLLGDGPDTLDFPLLLRDVILEDQFQALEEDQMTGIPLGNGPNNSEPFLPNP